MASLSETGAAAHERRERMREKLRRLRAAHISRSIAFVCDDTGTAVGMVWRTGSRWHAVSSLPCPHCGEYQCDGLYGGNKARADLLVAILGSSRAAAALQSMAGHQRRALRQ